MCFSSACNHTMPLHRYFLLLMLYYNSMTIMCFHKSCFIKMYSNLWLLWLFCYVTPSLFRLHLFRLSENKNELSDNIIISEVGENTEMSKTRKRKNIQSKTCSCTPPKRLKYLKTNHVSHLSGLTKQSFNHINRVNNEDIGRFFAQSGRVLLNLAHFAVSPNKNSSYNDSCDYEGRRGWIFIYPD